MVSSLWEEIVSSESHPLHVPGGVLTRPGFVLLRLRMLTGPWSSPGLVDR